MNSRKFTGLSIFLIALILVFCIKINLYSTDSDSNKIVRVGVVNLNKVFDGYDKFKVLEDKLIARQKKMDGELKMLKARIDELKTEIETDAQLQKAPNILEQKKQDYALKVYEYKYKSDAWTEDLRQKTNDLTFEIYNDIRKVTKIFAKEKGYDVILKTENPLPNTTSAVTEGIAIRNIIYYNNVADVSDTIIKGLNKLYSNRKAKKAE